MAWWDAGHRALPWRFPQHAADPYRVWISEVMLQQTQVAAVVPYYERFLARFPTLERLAAAGEGEVLALWSGLGYYARGRRLLAAAKLAVARHGGLPCRRDDLLGLPGFGPYTAAAVASIAFAVPAACVDGNVGRVLARLFTVRGAPDERRTRARLQALADALVPAERPGDWNQALMELGATVCRPAPCCDRCPVSSLCQARRCGHQRELPPPRARRPVRRLEVVCAVVERARPASATGSGRELLLVRRPSRGLFGGLWELPGAEVSPGRDARAALAGALAGLGIEAEPGAARAEVERVLTHRRLRLTAYACRAVKDAPVAPPLAWFPAEALPGLPLSTATKKLLDRANLLPSAVKFV